MNENPSIISHISLGTNNFDRAVAFYDQVIATVGGKRVATHPGLVAYGKEYPEFWLHIPIDGKPASVGNGTHISFIAESKEMVNAFYAAALATGGTDEGPPGGRAHYGEAYYGCFVRDLDGHKIEATFWDLSLQ